MNRHQKIEKRIAVLTERLNDACARQIERMKVVDSEKLFADDQFNAAFEREGYIQAEIDKLTLLDAQLSDLEVAVDEALRI